jgi:hypothetical protein
MAAMLHLLGMFLANLFKSRCRLEVENLFLRHQLNIALRRAADAHHVKPSAARSSCSPPANAEGGSELHATSPDLVAFHQSPWRISDGQASVISVNRHRTLTLPRLDPKYLEQHTKCRFSENLIGVQS